jgi:hypothetical protein
MRPALALALVLAAAGCKKAPDADTATSPTSFEWSQVSPDGKYEIRQRREPTGCNVDVVSRPGSKVLWSSRNCLPAPSGLVFLSPSADKLLVLDPYPPAPSADWSKVTLASLWTRGQVSRQYTGAEVLAGERVRDMHAALSWLKGDTYDELKASARLAGNGSQVSVDLVDGRTILLGFEGAALPAPPALVPKATAAATEPAPAAPAAQPAAEPEEATVRTRPAQPAGEGVAADEQGLYRWEDEQGELHFGVGAQVPARYRKRAVPVNATVGVVPMDFAGPSGGAQAPGGAAPAAEGVPPAGGAAPTAGGQPVRDEGKPTGGTPTAPPAGTPPVAPP